jgi:uncharacterized membrane protein YfcA
MGNVDMSLLTNLLLGSIPGILVGTLIASKSPEMFLRAAIAVILVGVSIKLLYA